MDLQLTLFGGTLYRPLARALATLFRKFVHASAKVVVRDDSLTVGFRT